VLYFSKRKLKFETSHALNEFLDVGAIFL